MKTLSGDEVGPVGDVDRAGVARSRNAVRYAVLLFAASLPILAQCTPHRAQAEIAVLAPEQEEPDRAHAVVGLNVDGGVPHNGSRPVPPKKADWQKRPPCSEKADEHLINGACWQGTSRTKPCGEELYEWKDGKCYRPLEQPERKPTSIYP